jgi:hypothetical protein
VEIGTEAAQVLEKDYINVVFVAVYDTPTRRINIERSHVNGFFSVGVGPRPPLPRTDSHNRHHLTVRLSLSSLCAADRKLPMLADMRVGGGGGRDSYNTTGP